MAELRDLRLSSRRWLPARLLSVRFSRAGGPGGQNVNKVATKADVRLDLRGATEFLGEEGLFLIRERLSTRLDSEGNLQVVSGEHREQAKNVEAALSRMEALLRAALVVPKKRRPTKISAGGHARRIEAKKRRGQFKKLRARVSGTE